MQSFDIYTAPKRNSFHWSPGTITWDEMVAWLNKPAKTKESGNYVLGTFRQTEDDHSGQTEMHKHWHRSKRAIVDRCALTLDVDFPEDGFADTAAELIGSAAIIHTTHSSTPSEPRYRLIIPLNRPVAPDEYHAAAVAMMERLGMDNFDKGSVQPERYMFKPSTQKPDWFWSRVLDGEPADVEALLEDFEPDLSQIPMPRPGKNKRDPFALEGTIGAFNRAYEDIQTLIDTYKLPYEESGANRWKLVGSVGAGGMGPVDAGLMFSHHTTDPAYGETCTAFDLARLHLFGEKDEKAKPGTPILKLPSTVAMLELASQDVNVLTELIGDDFKQEMEAAEASVISTTDWRLQFRRDSRTGAPKDEIHNWDLIANNDPAFNVLFFNELSLSMEITGDLPWRKMGTRVRFGAADRSSLALYIERTYAIRPSRAYLEDLLNDKALNRQVNPIRDYLMDLKWDGKPRVETCLPGVTPTPYSRLVARKAMVAAVARMMEPGIKWDHMIILFGPEGKGKSWWVERMARGFSSNLGDIKNKDTLITMQRSWIMMADESHSMRKADWDAQKEFITRTNDVFRMPYDREADVHPRHCVIWGSTNDDVFLKKQEGNRRFLIVRSEGRVNFDILTPEYIDQVWAEAMILWKDGEALFLTDEETELAAAVREEFTEEDPLVGLIQEFLDREVAVGWDKMSIEERANWLSLVDGGFTDDRMQTERLSKVCSIQIWVEALGRRKGDASRTDLLNIATALKSLPGWVSLPGRHRVPGYGPQVVFQRLGESLL